MTYNIELFEKAKQKGGQIDAIISFYSMSFEYVSKKLASKLGYSEDEMIDMSLRKVIDMDPKTLLKMMSDFMFKKGEDAKRLIHKDGSKIEASGHVSPFSYKGEPYLTIRNIKF